MNAERRPYRREPEEKRREDLIAATLALVAEGGTRAVTVRAIAERAGVTAGLIRHYFHSKDQLVADAYRALMDGMLDETASVLKYAPQDPYARLTAFVAAVLRPPVVDREAVIRWASFIQETKACGTLLDIHRQTYLGFRNHLQSLLAALPEPRSDKQLRHLAIAGNAVIDGLWIEAGLLPDAFEQGELVEIGIATFSTLLGVDLDHYLQLMEPPSA